MDSIVITLSYLASSIIVCSGYRMRMRQLGTSSNATITLLELRLLYCRKGLAVELVNKATVQVIQYYSSKTDFSHMSKTKHI